MTVRYKSKSTGKVAVYGGLNRNLELSDEWERVEDNLPVDEEGRLASATEHLIDADKVAQVPASPSDSDAVAAGTLAGTGIDVSSGVTEGVQDDGDDAKPRRSSRGKK